MEDMREEISQLRQFRTHVALRRNATGKQQFWTNVAAAAGFLVALALGVYYHRHEPAAWLTSKAAHQRVG